VVSNKADERHKIVSALTAFAAQNNLPERVVQAADLALEEHLTNILSYAYDDSAVHEIRVRFAMAEGSFQVEVEDDGKAFNPLRAPPADVSSSLSERRVGGLGIHLMRQFMDELEYRRERGRNVLTMRKRISPTSRKLD
jgi:anti-sigma regulatory factor (Ser/Thr protein kinase)